VDAEIIPDLDVFGMGVFAACCGALWRFPAYLRRIASADF
jgi:hypothetical protein